MRILFTVWPYAGHVYPCLAVALALRDRGHEVAFYTGAAADAELSKTGFRRFPFRALARRIAELVSHPDPSDHPELYRLLTERYTTVGAPGPLARFRQTERFYLEMVAGTIEPQVSDLRAALSAFQPDAVVTDPFVWAPVLVLRDIQTAPVSVFSFFGGSMVPGPDAPPPGLGLPSPRNWRTRTTSRLTRFFLGLATREIRRASDRARAKYGLAPLHEPYFATASRVPLHMVTCSPEYDYGRKDLPASVHYVGPCVYDPPAAEQGWAARLSPASPVIYVSEGTCQVRKPVLLTAAVQGLAGGPYQLAISTGRERQFTAADLGASTPNVIVEPWVSQAELFPLASAIVTNGGSGAVRAALQMGIPMVIAPMEWDQLENAQRVAEAGAGIRLAVSGLTPDRVRAAVERLLADPSFRANARRIADSFSRYGGGREAARLIENLAAESPAGQARRVSHGG
jgi:MGT family glycosyltransferase